MFTIDYRNPIIIHDMQELDERLDGINVLFQKSIYISGASGMLASYLVAYLIWLNEIHDAKINIFAGIRKKEKAIARFGLYAEKEYFHIIQDDVNMPIPAYYHFNYIIHAASLASPQYYGLIPVEIILPNVIGTYQLLEYAKREHIQGFLFFSSGSVYGSVKNEDTIKETTIGEMDHLARGNVYSESKRLGETLCKAYYNEYEVPIKIARIHHTYGPTVDLDNDTRVFSEFINKVVHNQDLVIMSNGEAKRSFSYITDTICALLTIILAGKNGEAYNIANPNEFISIRDLAKIIIDLVPERGLSIRNEIRHMIGYNPSQMIRVTPIDVHKLENIGWSSVVSVEEGLWRAITAIEYNKTNKDAEE